MKKAIVLLSGGLDSSTVLFYAKSRGYKCSCLIFDYGQKHKKEIKSAVKIAKLQNSEYKIIKFSLPWSKSALTAKKTKIPKRGVKKILSHSLIPSTYVPARNTIFLSFAVSYAESIGANTIFIGANALDYSGYPDCRPDYFKAYGKVIKLGTKDGHKIKIIAPLLKMTKKEIVKLGNKLKVPYDLTWSCYKGGKKPCGTCDSCVLREKGFKNN